MGTTPPLRYIHIDDYSPVGIANGPDDAAFANARADLAATGYRTLVIGTRQYWLQNGFNLNSYTDFNGNTYPKIANVLITADGLSGGPSSSAQRIFSDLPATIILSPGYADPTLNTYIGGSEPCRTTGSIQLADSCGITNLRIMSLAAYEYALAAALSLDNLALANTLIWDPIAGMAAPVGNANGMLFIPAGGGTAIQIDGDFCFLDNLLILGFRNQIVSVPVQGSGGGPGGARIGWIRSDAANGLRIDNCAQAGVITGPLQNLDSMTSGLAAQSTITVTGLVGNGSAGTTMSVSILNSTDPPLTNAFAVGAPLKLTLSVDETGGACYSPYNGNNLTPIGTQSNRFDSTILSVTAGATTTALVLSIPGVPINTFFDSTCTETAVCVGSVTGTSLTITTVDSGFLSPGQSVSGPGISTMPLSYIESISTSAGVSTCILSQSSTATSGIYNMAPGATVVASVSTSPSGLGSPTLTISGSAAGVAIGQLVTGTGIIPGTSIISALEAGTYTLGLPQLTPPGLLNAFSGSTGAVIVGSIATSVSSSGTTTSILTNKHTITGTAAVGQLLVGAGIPPATVISSTGTSNTLTLASGSSLKGLSIQGSDINLIGVTGLSGVVTSNGTTTTLVSNAGNITASNGEALFGLGLIPGSYLQAGSGSTTGTIATIQAAGSPLEPIALIAHPGIAFTGSIAGTSLSVGSYITAGGSLALGYPIVGQGVPPNTFISSNGSPWIVSNSQTTPASGSTLFVAQEGVATVSSVAGTVMTVVSNSAGTTLSAGVLVGPGIQPGTSIVGSISVGSGGCGLYGLSVPQQIDSFVPLTFMPSVNAVGSISGSILTVTQGGTFTAGQQISGPGLLANTTISSVSSVSNTLATYILNQAAASAGTVVLTASPVRAIAQLSAGLTGPSATVTVTALNFGTIGLGQQLVGFGVSNLIFVTSIISSSTFTVSSPILLADENVVFQSPSGAVFEGAVNVTSGSGTLSVTSVQSGVIGAGHLIIGADIPASPKLFVGAIPTSPYTGVGGIGNYPLQSSSGTETVSVTLGSMASVPPPSNLIGTLSGTTLSVTKAILALDSILIGPGIAPLTTVAGLSPQYVVMPEQVVGASLTPTSLNAVEVNNAFSLMGTISGSTLTVIPAGGNVLAVGQQLIGPNIPANTIITSVSSSGSVASVTTIQNVGINPIAVVPGAVPLAGSVVGTVLTASVISGTMSTGLLISGPGVALGTSIQTFTGSTTVTCGVSVPQSSFGSPLTLYAGGEVAVGSVTGTSVNVAVSSTGSIPLSSGQVIVGNEILPGTNIASGTAIAVPQTAASQTLTLLNPIWVSSGLGTISGLDVNFSQVRPGRLIELNNSASWAINQVQSFNKSTTIRLIDSVGIHINQLHSDCNPTDMNTTVIDLQGGSGDVIINGAGVVNVFTFLNNNAAAGATALAQSVSMIGCNCGVSIGGTLISQTGAGMHVSASNFGKGVINLQAQKIVSFSATEFSLGATGIPATTIVYGTGVSAAIFDPSCQNVP